MVEERAVPWRELLEAIFRHRRVVVLCVLLGVVVGLTQVVVTAPVYRASGRIQLTAQAVPGPREGAMSNAEIQAEIELIRSPKLVHSVLAGREGDASNVGVALRETGWISRGIVQVQMLGAAFRGVQPPDPDMLKAQRLAQQIETERLGRSNLVEVAFVSENPETSAEFVNDLLREHVQRIGQLNRRGSARPLYEEEREQALNRWQAGRAALNSFRENEGADFLPGDDTHLRDMIAELQGGRVAAETEVLELNARESYLVGQLAERPTTVKAEWVETEDESVRQLKSRILELEIQRSEALSRFTPESTIIRNLDRQIVEAERLLASKEGDTLSATTTTIDPSYQALQVDFVKTQAQLSSAGARVRALSTQIEEYRNRLRDLEMMAGELERLENEVETARELYRQYSDQAEKARVSTVLGESGFVNVSIVDQAAPPTSPLPSRIGLKLLFAFLVGLTSGLVVAVVLDWLDPSVKGSVQATRLCGVPVVSEIPLR